MRERSFFRSTHDSDGLVTNSCELRFGHGVGCYLAICVLSSLKCDIIYSDIKFGKKASIFLLVCTALYLRKHSWLENLLSPILVLVSSVFNSTDITAVRTTLGTVNLVPSCFRTTEPI